MQEDLHENAHGVEGAVSQRIAALPAPGKFQKQLRVRCEYAQDVNGCILCDGDDK